MVIYVCEKCGKIFDKKWSYVYHSNKKNKCILSNILNNDHNGGLTNLINTVNELKKQQNLLEADNRKLAENNKKLEKEVEELNREIKNVECNVNNVNNVNITNNIIIRAYGNENLNFTNDEIKKILMCRMDSIQKYVEKVHCNKDKPENRNVYIKNITHGRKYVCVYDGDEWIFKSKKDILDELKQKGIDYISVNMDTMKNELSDSVLKSLNRAIEKYESEDIEWTKKVDEKLELILLNNAIHTIKK